LKRASGYMDQGSEGDNKENVELADGEAPRALSDNHQASEHQQMRRHFF